MVKSNGYIPVRWICIAIVFALAELNLFAKSRPGNDTEHRKIGIETSVSTMGPGANLVCQWGSDWFLRAGFENIRFVFPFSFEENDISYEADLKYRSGSVSLLTEWYFTRSVYLAGGVAYNLFHPQINGNASKDWQYGDIIIPADEIGEFSMLVSPSLRLSPYLGAGIGRNLSRDKRFSFHFEIGSYFQGSPQVDIAASGLLAPTADESHKQKEILEKQFKAYYLYPVIKLGISFVLVKL